MAQASPTATPAVVVKAWADIPVAKSENRITIHYHRSDGSYEDANLWTWDGSKDLTPKNNAIKPIGQDDFGAVFQLDRASYGDSAKIGLIPRIGDGWSQKDGGDKFWTAEAGQEVWLISGKDAVAAEKPDVSPHIEAAYIDAPDKIIVRLTDAAPPSVSAVILQAGSEGHPARVTGESDSPLQLEVTPQEPLEVTKAYSIRVEGFGEPMPLTPRGVLDNPELFLDRDVVLGATYTQTASTFRIFAPTARQVTLVLYDKASGAEGRRAEALQQMPKGIWETTIREDLGGKFYTYQLEGPGLDPQREVLDPYAINAVASSSRGLISALPSPATAGPKVASATDMVVYEMHVRDFTIAPNSGTKNRGLYPSWTEAGTRLPSDPRIKTALDHLTELGVTHVQIMPVQDFDNDEAARKYNWGYVTTNFFSPEGMFATNVDDGSRVREFKALVDALHARNIGVIMDVVYNHTAEKMSFPDVVPDYYYRHLSDGTMANGSACGNEFRSESPMGRKLMLDSLKFWVKNYGVDGFRFDLMALLDQETMRQADHELRAINPNIVLYGEPWMATTTPLAEKTDKQALREMQPIGAFNDDFRNALKGSPDGKDSGWIQDGSNRDALQKAMLVSNWFATPAQSLNYMTCHDNLVLWDKLKISMPGATDAQIKATMKLGYLALFTSQGVPFLHGGEEFARSKGGDNNSYVSPDSVNQVDWDLKRKNFDLFTYTRDLIALRKAHPVFRLRTRDEVSRRLSFPDSSFDKTLLFTLDGTGIPGENWKQVCVVMNADSGSVDVKLPPGNWFVALDERGRALMRSVAGKASLLPKAGLVLFQQ